MSEADRPGFGGYPISWTTPDTTPSIYPRRECKELPGWLSFDNQVNDSVYNKEEFKKKKNLIFVFKMRVNYCFQILTFDGYFQETVWEVDKCPLNVRKVKIYYFLEDGTIQVNEPKVDNSGMTQGCF